MFLNDFNMTILHIIFLKIKKIILIYFKIKTKTGGTLSNTL